MVDAGRGWVEVSVVRVPRRGTLAEEILLLQMLVFCAVPSQPSEP